MQRTSLSNADRYVTPSMRQLFMCVFVCYAAPKGIKLLLLYVGQLKQNVFLIYFLFSLVHFGVCFGNFSSILSVLSSLFEVNKIVNVQFIGLLNVNKNRKFLHTYFISAR